MATEQTSKFHDSLPFSEPRQQALLGHLLINTQFFLQARTYIEPEWFIDRWHGLIWRAALAYFTKFGKPPTVEEVKEHENIRREENNVRLVIYNKINLAVEATQRYRLEPIRDELQTWLHARLYHTGVMSSERLYNQQKFPEAFETLRETSRQIATVTLTPDIQVDWSDPAIVLEQQKVARANALTFGVSAVDKLLLPENTGGSLIPGDTTVMLAPTNIGKTTSMITIARHNFFTGKHILMLTHEGRPEDIQEKIWCSVFDCSRQELMEKYHTDPERMKFFAAQLQKRFVYIPLNKAGLTVEQVEAIIRRRIDEHVALYGRGFDLVIDDYPAKLTTAAAKSGTFQKRNIDEYVYNYFVQLALEYNFHALLAIQTNREGSKTNKGRGHDGSRLLTMEDVHESFGPMQIATNVISINRDPIAEARGRVTYYICKSRSSQVGWAVVCKSNYGHALTHGEHLGATYYRGTNPMTEHIDTLLEQYIGTEIPLGAQIRN